METEDNEPLRLEVVAEPESGEEHPRTFPFGQFVLVPLLIIAVCVGLFLTFKWLTGEGKTAADYLNELKYAAGDKRWQAAFELSKFVNYSKDPAVAHNMLPELMKAFQGARKSDSYDPRIRRYLALAMGRIGDARAVPVLLEGLTDPDIDTQLYSVWALGLARDDAAIQPLIQIFQSEDAALREMTVYVLGNYSGDAVRQTLGAALQDVRQDVRWNAALGLARQGDASGRETILQLLDRNYLNGISTLSEQKKGEFMINALRAARHLQDPSINAVVQKLAESDPLPAVRQAAMEVLKQ